MRRTPLIPALLVLLATLTSCGEDRPAVPRRQVHLLAIDGADLDIVRGLIGVGRLPHFARVISEGASGGLFSDAPRHTPVVWTTIATGRPAVEHGIEELVVVDRAANRVRPVSSDMRRTEAIWDIASGKDRDVRVTGWPGTWPPDPVRGVIVTDRFVVPGPAAERLVHPATEIARLAPLVRRPGDVSPAALSRFILPDGQDPRETVLAAAVAAEETRRAVAAAIGTDAHLVVRWSGLLGVASHLFMGAASPKLERVNDGDFERYGQAVVAAYDDADRLLGETLSSLGEDTVLLVVSPYGFRHGIQRLASDPAPGSLDAEIQHRPRGFVLAFGAGVRPGEEIDGARAVDIVPTILALLGLPGADDLGGRFLEEAFTIPAPGTTVPSWERGRYERQLALVAGDGEARRARLELFPELAFVGSATHLRDPLSAVVLAIRQRRVRDLRRYLRQAEEELPANPRLKTTLGGLLRATGNPGRAETAYREAIRLDPLEVSARAGLSLVLGESGRTDAALATIGEAIRLEPADAGLHAIRAGLLDAVDDSRACLVAYARAVKLEPDDVAVRVKLGSLLLSRGRLGDAERELRKAVRLDPFVRDAWRDLVVVVVRRAEGTPEGGPDRDRAVRSAKSVLDEAVRRFPADPEFRSLRSRLEQG